MVPAHAHGHGLVDPSIKRSRAGLRAVLVALAILAATAIPLGIAFLLRSERPERYAGNWLAARVRTAAGRALDSPALVADGNHARADAYVSLAVVAGAAALALGLEVADPLIGLGISVLIMRITWHSWQTVRAGHV